MYVVNFYYDYRVVKLPYRKLNNVCTMADKNFRPPLSFHLRLL
jgi:hypothetical protein